MLHILIQCVQCYHGELKNLPLSINILDVITEMILLYSIYQAPSREPIFTFLAAVQTKEEFQHVFILELACTEAQRSHNAARILSQIWSLKLENDIDTMFTQRCLNIAQYQCYNIHTMLPECCGNVDPNVGERHWHNIHTALV